MGLLSSLFGGKKNNTEEIAAETKQIAINELGVPQNYYNETILDKEKWDYIRNYANYLRKNGNNAETVFLKNDIQSINIDECSWARLLAIGMADLYKEEKPYIDIIEKMTIKKK